MLTTKDLEIEKKLCLILKKLLETYELAVSEYRSSDAAMAAFITIWLDSVCGHHGLVHKTWSFFDVEAKHIFSKGCGPHLRAKYVTGQQSLREALQSTGIRRRKILGETLAIFDDLTTILEQNQVQVHARIILAETYYHLGDVDLALQLVENVVIDYRFCSIT
jgi:hypothetical protein